MLSALFKRQHKLMVLLGVLKQKKESAIQEAISGIIEESAEILREFRARSKTLKWRTSKIDYNHLFEESVDVLFYLIELWILMGVDHTMVVNQYIKKYKRNIERIK